MTPLSDFTARLASVPIVGRVAELRLLISALDDVTAGAGTTILVRGEGGVGKTRLALALAEQASARGFQLVTGRVWKGTAFGGARGRTDVPKIVDWYMEGKIEIDPMITHTMPLSDINRAFDLMHAGKSIRSVVLF